MLQKSGSLVIIGTGIKAVAQATIESEGHIRSAEKLYYLVADPVTEMWLKELNPSATSLASCYAEEKSRKVSYEEMISRIYSSVQKGERVCLAMYGHPGVFVYPTHALVRLLKKENYPVEMLCGVSAEDCLFADIGVDPARFGCFSVEATDYLLYNRNIDPRSHLIIWQIGVVGDTTFKKQKRYDASLGITLLIERLLTHYDEKHRVIVYEAAQYAICAPRIEEVPLAQLASIRLTPISTLYVPPIAQVPPDSRVMSALGIFPEQLITVAQDGMG